MLVQRAVELVIPTLPNRQGVGVLGPWSVHPLDVRGNGCELVAGARGFDGKVDLPVSLVVHFESVVAVVVVVVGHGFSYRWFTWTLKFLNVDGC